MARPRRHQMTAIDYVVIALSPALIMALVGSLCFFLLEIGYQGQYSGRLNWILFWFVFAIVLIARISIEEGKEKALFYGLALSGAVAVAMLRFVDSPLVAWGLMGVVWWCANKLTWDCTVIDDEQDASGEGLLQVAGLERGENSQAADLERADEPSDEGESSPRGRRHRHVTWWQRWLGAVEADNHDDKKPHAPGVWVVYFSLAALPLFGLGQSMVPAGDAARGRYVFCLLLVYVAAGLGLLLTTSFLGLRRYLRQRKLEMPLPMTGVWLGVGGVLIAALLLAGVVLPRPSAEYPLESLIAKLVGSPTRRASDYAVLTDSPGEGEGRPSSEASANQATQQGKGAQNGDQQGAKQQGGKQQSGKQQGGGEQAGEQKTADKQGGGQQGGKQQGEGQKGGKQAGGQKGGKQPGGEQQGGKQPGGDQQRPDQKGGDQQKGAEQQGGRQQGGEQQSGRKPGDTSSKNSKQNDSKQDSQSPQQQPAKGGSSQTANQGAQPPKEMKPPPKGGVAGKKKPNSSAGAPAKPPQPPKAPRPPRFNMSLAGWIRWLIYAVMLGAAIYGFIRYRAQVLAFLRQMLDELKAIWRGLFGRKPPTEADAGEEESRPVPRPFAAFADPFANGSAARSTPDELVRYTFAALEAWAFERGAGRRREATPHEFAQQLGDGAPELAADVQTLANLYGQITYARGSLTAECLPKLRRLWQKLRAPEDVMA